VQEIKAVIGYPVKKCHNAWQVLLAIKQRGVANGLRMPPGGKLNPGETNEEAMLRELSEELRMIAESDDLEDTGILFVRYYQNNHLFQSWKIKIFLIHGWTGIPTDTKEMKDPRWFTFRNRHQHDLPIDQMPNGDELFSLKIFSGRKIGLSLDYNIEDMTLRRQPRISFEINRLARPR